MFPEVFMSLNGLFAITSSTTATLNTHTADTSSLPLHTHTQSYKFPILQHCSYWITILSTFHPSSPLGSEEAVEVCAGGVSRLVLQGLQVYEDVIASPPRPLLLTNQPRLQEGRPAALQGLIAPQIMLRDREGER